jgi:glycerol dehydrogenase
VVTLANYYDFTSIQQYTIGQGALKEIKRITFGMGETYLIIVDERHLTERIKHNIVDSFTQPIEKHLIQSENIVGRAPGLLNTLQQPDPNEVVIDYEFYNIPGKICSYETASAVGRKIKEYGPDVVVAVGSSKCLDIVRTATHFVDCYRRPKIVLCPTIVASNASATGVSIIYNQEGTQMLDFWSLAFMPECVIVDTDIVINGPVQAFVAGIGDQISSSIEALHTLERIGAYETCDRFCIAHHEAAIDVLKKYSYQAVESIKTRDITPEFEWVCHAITRYTGPQIAAATAYLSHILDEALIGFPAVAQKPHGHIVGYGVLPEMVSFGTPDAMYEWIDLYKQIGIPVSLAELGIPDASYDDIVKACEAASDKIMASRAVVRWTPDEMAAAIIKADQLATQYLSQK